MKTKTKWIVGVLAVILVALAVFGTSTDLFQGKLRFTPAMSCGNSADVDGLFSACTGDSIEHETSGVTATVVYYNNSSVKLSLRGATSRSIIIGMGETKRVQSRTGYTVEYTYTQRTLRHGADIQINSYRLSPVSLP